MSERDRREREERGRSGGGRDEEWAWCRACVGSQAPPTVDEVLLLWGVDAGQMRT